MDPRKLTIVKYPHQALRRGAKPVERITEEVRAVASRMLELMHNAPPNGGVGLAAPQVGLPWRLFVANHTHDPAGDRVYVNPVLSEPSKRLEDYEEGCLSLPEVTGIVRRPFAITLDALDLEGNPIHQTAEDLEARVWQHETDHLDGVLIIDRMAPIDRMANRRALKELEEAVKG